MFQSWPDVDSADEDLERVEGCYSVLLDAGSDISSVITSDVDHEAGWLSAFTEALDAGTLVRHSCRSLVLVKQLITYRPKPRR